MAAAIKFLGIRGDLPRDHVKIWDLKAKKEAAAFEVGFGGLFPGTLFAFSPDGKKIVASSVKGLYVFDAHGNCVARDDEVTTRTVDDTAVEWVPAPTGTYTITVKALGKNAVEFLMTVRQGGAS